MSSHPRCDYFEAGVCRSCSLIETPYAEQLRLKEHRCRTLLAEFVSDDAWLPPIPGGEAGFRNKAKLAVGGRRGRVTLGILDGAAQGIDLRDCLIHEPGVRDAIPRIADVVNGIGIAPYDVPRRSGELKYVHVVGAPNGALMVRFVVRSEQGAALVRRGLNDLRRAVPEAAVISVNLLPEHKAVLEGEREEMLLGSALRMDLAVPLYLQPQSFFQTNTAVARALYAQASEWMDRAQPASLWDLYCGVGGFALHCSGAADAGERQGPVREVLGIEVSEAAVRSARRSAREAGIRATFRAGDATAVSAATPAEAPDLVIVNPPRRGIGPELAAQLERAEIPHLIYSSCNPQSLARDLAAMPSFAVREARVFDMFPHTDHLEVAVCLQRSGRQR